MKFKPEMGAIVAIIALLALILAIVYFFPTQLAGGTSSSSTSGVTISTSTESVSTGTESVSGLILGLSLNASSIQAGHAISITTSLFNSLSTENNVTAASNWAVPDLVIGPCGPTDSPIAFAVVQGFYTASNISSAPRVQYGVGCTTGVGGIRLYSFQPMSDIASAVGNCNTNPCFTKPVAWTRSLNGYWSGNEYVNFTSGVYTVVVADEWGRFSVSQFTVQG